MNKTINNFSIITIEPINLNVEPLSIAKFFYEKGVEDIAIIQRLIYLVYYEVLEEEKLLLFKEEWQAWSGGPVVESVFYKMRGRLGLDRKELFNQVSPFSFLNEDIAVNYCKEIFNNYQECVKINEEHEFLQKSFNKPWEVARYNLNNGLEKRKIETIDIIHFADKESEKKLLLSQTKLFLWITGKRQYANKVYEVVMNTDFEEVTNAWKKSLNY